MGILLGSKSDRERLEQGLKTLKEHQIPYRLAIASAHRCPKYVEEVLEKWTDVGVWIAVAGKSAHLAGAIASRYIQPVIGVPVEGSPLHGLDALLSTVQMPAGIPVATVGIGAFENACLLAMRILALSDPELSQRLQESLMKWEEDYRKIPTEEEGAFLP